MSVDFPCYSHCQVCHKELGFCISQIGSIECKDCNYKYQAIGSYAACVTINEHSFHLDDGYDDSRKMKEYIANFRKEGVLLVEKDKFLFDGTLD